MCYSAAATCIIELAEDGDPEAKLDEADRILKQIPKLTKKIAGKSLPIEVSCNPFLFHSLPSFALSRPTFRPLPGPRFLLLTSFGSDPY